MKRLSHLKDLLLDNLTLSALRAFAANCVLRGMSITLEIETADHDNSLARCSSTFRPLISRKGRPMLFPSSRARATPAFVRPLRFSYSSKELLAFIIALR